MPCNHNGKCRNILHTLIKSTFVWNDIVNKISNLSNINIVNVPFLCAGGRGGKGVAMPATITEQTKTLRSTNKACGKLTGVNIVFHQWCDYRQYQQG